MNKTEFAAKLAKKADVSKAKALDILDIIFGAKPGEGIIAVELDAGRKVTVPGFGTFGTKTRAARTGRNPATGAQIEIPAKTYAYFRPGKTLRERVSD
ncbi:MAG: DNA-binding protein HU [Proteobacteria bacterium]|nr:MAG: DNA-binding protein HU [Pseudomonadota bacterium]